MRLDRTGLTVDQDETGVWKRLTVFGVQTPVMLKQRACGVLAGYTRVGYAIEQGLVFCTFGHWDTARGYRSVKRVMAAGVALKANFVQRTDWRGLAMSAVLWFGLLCAEVSAWFRRVRGVGSAS